MRRPRRLHWFSPLPPARTGIAEIAECTAPALSRLTDVTLWTTQDSWSPELEKVAPVKRFHPGASSLPRGDDDVCVYHLGNHWSFHSAIWRAAVMNPGIVVLHDLRLPGLFLGDALRNTEEMAQVLAQLAVPEEQVLAALKANDESPDWGEEQFLFLRLAIARARAVVVHTLGGLKLLEHEGVTGVHAHLPYRRPASNGKKPTSSRAARRSGSRRRLVFLGHIGPYRRLPSVLQALAGMKERSQFQLDVFGSSRDKFGSLRALAAASGVGDCVRFHGFASDDALDSALDDCDAGINLRYPSKGESSLSQLRLWSHAVPTIVTREAWYAELGDDVVTYVRPDHEIDDLRAALRSLLASPEGFAEKGRRGLERLETVHSPEHYAQSFVNLAESLPTPGTATETA